MSSRLFTAQVPVVDLSLGEEQAAVTLKHACEEAGFFYCEMPPHMPCNINWPTTTTHTHTHIASLAVHILSCAHPHACTHAHAVRGHGVREELLARVFDLNHTLFALPLEVKQSMLADANNRGWTPFREVRGLKVQG